MVRKFPSFRSERQRRTTYFRTSSEASIFERIFRRIIVPFNFQPKFADFCCSIRHWKFPDMQTGIFGRMESAPDVRSKETLFECASSCKREP